MEAVFVLYQLLEKPCMEIFHRLCPLWDNVLEIALSYFYRIKTTFYKYVQHLSFFLEWQFLYIKIVKVISANWILIVIGLLLINWFYKRQRILHCKDISSKCCKKKTCSISELCNMIKECHKPNFVEEVISILEDAKLDINSVQPNSNSGLSPFLCACMSGNKELVEYMLLHGANINSQTACQDGPLHIATFACANQNSKECFDVIAILIQAGCELNSKNWLGNTPLCIAASYDRKRLIRYLLFQGGDPSICNNDGVYPINFATNAGNTHLASLLAIDVPNPHVWDFIEPHTPPRIKLGLQTPSKQHLVESSFNLNKRRLKMFRTPRPIHPVYDERYRKSRRQIYPSGALHETSAKS